MPRWLRTVVVSDEEKAPGGAQEGERKRTAVDVSKSLSRRRNRGSDIVPGMSLAGARVLARWCPACRRREPGLRLRHGTWEGRCRYRPPSRRGWRAGGREGARQRRTPETLSTVAAPAGGPARSSAEASVMGVERRGRLISWFVRASNRAACAVWEETSEQVESDGQVVCHFQTAGVGGVSAGQGQPGRAASWPCPAAA